MKKKLFVFDLDGTLLTKDKKNPLSEKTKETIEILKNRGHIVCLLTGRPWSATKCIYDELKLDTVIGNYNGGHLHNPSDYTFIPSSNTIEPLISFSIIKDEKLRRIAKNIIIENPKKILSWKPISKNLSNFLHLKESNVVKRITLENFTSKPNGILVPVKKEWHMDIDLIANHFRSKYGDEVSISTWNLEMEDELILDIVSKNSRKDIALIQMARYYDIDMDNVLAFGDSMNDYEMLSIAGVGVAMKNSSPRIKEVANIITRFSNNEEGIYKFVKWYCGNGEEKVDKTIYSFGKKEHTKQIIQD
ncbi:MAG: HAD family phosphatase [Mycoplasmataceae bacterium]|nr:HAD family phosphatase [Mycoplasmataceae bacterium]